MPDCTSAGGVFIQHLSEEGKLIDCTVLSVHEYGSTNQRGELLALLKALDYIYSAKQEAWIITDSEYLFNAMTKAWYERWLHNNWKTASGEDVKNKDIWHEIAQVFAKCDEVHFFHIKGHVIPFGKVTARTLLTKDSTGYTLLKNVYAQYDKLSPKKEGVISNAQELSEKNNGFMLQPKTFRSFVVANTMADAIATMVVEAADRNI